MNKDELNKQGLQKAFELLLDDGYFNDGQVFDSTIIEHHFDTLASAIEDMGYPNKLGHCGKYYEGIGPFYSVFDAVELSLDEAREMERSYAEEKEFLG